MADFNLMMEVLRAFHQEKKEIRIRDYKIGNNELKEGEVRIEKAEERIQNTEKVITAMLKLHLKLEDKLLDLESHSRRENLGIYGESERAKMESTTMTLFEENILRKGLKLTEDTPDLQIERAHQSVGSQPLDDTQPRCIIMNFLKL